MGYSTNAKICKNVAQLGKFGGRLNTDKFENDPNISDEQFSEIDENGVTSLKHRWNKTGHTDHGCLYPDIWQKIIKYKGGNTKVIEVFLLNSSPYEMVGEEDWVVFSNNYKAVKRFLKDFGLSATPIVKTEIVQQTI